MAAGQSALPSGALLDFLLQDRHNLQLSFFFLKRGPSWSRTPCPTALCAPLMYVSSFSILHGNTCKAILANCLLVGENVGENVGESVGEAKDWR